MKEIDSRFTMEWAIATAGSSILIVVFPKLSPLLLGICQWLVLRQYVTGSWRWLLATAISTYLSALGGGAFWLGLMFVSREGDFGAAALIFFVLISLILLVRSGIQCIALATIPQQRQYGWWVVTGTLAAMCWIAVILVSLFISSAVGYIESLWRVGAIWQWLLIYGVAGAIAGVIEGRSLLSILKR